MFLLILVGTISGCGSSGNTVIEDTGTSEAAAVAEDTGAQETAADAETAGTVDDTCITEDTTTSLYKKYADYFPVGAAVDSRSYKDAHVYLLKKHFNSIVCENEMKWESLQPSEGVFRYTVADSIIGFAEDNNMTVRGHCLVWHNQTPRWVFRDASNARVSKETLLERIRNHITNVMTHFKGRICCWDVVNEAIAGNDGNGNDAGEDLSRVESWGYRNSEWYTICGEDYIFEAFRAARAADPGARLFYNDYWNYLDEKREAIIVMIKKLQAEHLIDGVGLQCHLNISVAQEKISNQTIFQTVENLEKEIRAYAALGLEVQITELDVSMYTRDYTSSDKSRWYTEAELNDELEDKLAARYEEFFSMFRRNGELITNVTFWGIADDNTWLSEFSSGRPDHPLLFDKHLKAKKAFFAITDF
ncbi:MAG: endo-1,4-beta-xylanase [Spirochaetales bacterium]|nr:endo-1,4-beta-xylanase [Spirochaetales bacterium]